jgi:hypothetical protein
LRHPNWCAVRRRWQFEQRTSHFAISTSSTDQLEYRTRPDRHALGGRIAVIEVQHERVSLAAINARMLYQELDQAAQISGLVEPDCLRRAVAMYLARFCS